MSISSKLQMSRSFENKKTVSPSKEEKLLSTEIIKTANLLFGAFEPYFIWDFVSRTFEAACANSLSNKNKKEPSSDSISVSELSKLVEFLLDKLSIVSMFFLFYMACYVVNLILCSDLNRTRIPRVPINNLN